MADAVRTTGFPVESAGAHVPEQAVRHDSSTSDNDELKRDEENEIIGGGASGLGGAGVTGLPKENAETAAPDSKRDPVEDEKVTSVPQSSETSATNENGDAKDIEAVNGDSKDPEDEEANMVFPSGISLALLTFGLCMAT
jgi:hypothetical protein